MCIPPEIEEPAMHFSLLKKIAYKNNLQKLSMGMSNDFEEAIKFGLIDKIVETRKWSKKTPT